jgi:hypothetical protein
MGKYGQVALLAVELIKNKTVKDPKEAWKIASSQIFGIGTSSQEKGCPRCAFLSLCAEGMVSGIISGKYTNSIKNKAYTLRALELIKGDISLINNKNRLWELVTDNNVKHEGQLDVIIELFNAGLIKI